MSYQTILPYTGGKRVAVKLISQFIPDNIRELGSPFMGGGSVEVYNQAKGIRVHAADKLGHLVCFWQEVLEDPLGFAEAFKGEIPVGYPLAPYREALRRADTRLQRGLLCFILIISGFSNMLSRTGGSPSQVRKINEKRWKHVYRELRRFRAPNLSVVEMDCFDYLEQFPERFLYLDPPYPPPYSQDLYGFDTDLHGGFDHERLAEVLLSRPGGWVLSYGDCEIVRDLYAGCKFALFKWDQNTAGKSKVGHELVIRPPGAEL